MSCRRVEERLSPFGSAAGGAAIRSLAGGGGTGAGAAGSLRGLFFEGRSRLAPAAACPVNRMNGVTPAATPAPLGPTNGATTPPVTTASAAPNCGQSALLAAIPSTVVPTMISGAAAGITP